jgi:hypothetical protein
LENEINDILMNNLYEKKEGILLWIVSLWGGPNAAFWKKIKNGLG